MNKRNTLLRHDRYKQPAFRMIFREPSELSIFWVCAVYLCGADGPGGDFDDAGDRKMISNLTQVHFEGTFCGALFRLIFDSGLGVCEDHYCDGHNQR